MRSFTGQAAGKIFAQALAMHPNFVPFWISAASWEYFSNANIQAARVLLQRANRLNPQSQEILLEYCRLELAYREKVMQRLEIFGVEDSELKEAAVSLSDVPSGESNSQGVLEQTASDKLDKVDQKKQNPFFVGAIPLAVYHAAVKAFPKDLQLRIQFALIIGSFQETTLILDAIYTSIETDFGKDATAQSFVARRPYDNPERKSKAPTKGKKTEEPEVIDLFDITNQAVSNFESQLSSYPSTILYEHYIAFLLDVLNSVDSSFSSTPIDPNSQAQDGANKPEENSSLTIFLRKKISLVFKEAFTSSHISELLCTKWVDTLLAMDRLDEAIETAEKCSAALPSNPTLHVCFFSLVAQVSDLHTHWKSTQSSSSSKRSTPKKGKGDSSKTEEDKSSIVFSSTKLKKYLGWSHDEMGIAISKALKQIDLDQPSSGDLFIFYWNHLLHSEENVKSPDDDERTAEESLALAAAMNHYKRTLITLHGKSLQQFKLATLSSALSRWNDKSEESVARIRAVYQSGLDCPPTSFQYFKLCINFETSLSTSRSVTLSRRLFESAVSDFGKLNQDVWLCYIDWETALGQHANASQLFTRAKRTLSKPDEFIHEYTRKMDAEFNLAASHVNPNAMDVE
jgi:tetratricopeptide (TPR) repeat protein